MGNISLCDWRSNPAINTRVVPRKHIFKIFQNFSSNRFRISRKYWINVSSILIVVIASLTINITFMFFTDHHFCIWLCTHILPSRSNNEWIISESCIAFVWITFYRYKNLNESYGFYMMDILGNTILHLISAFHHI